MSSASTSVERSFGARHNLPRFVLSDGMLEALKWVALLLMVLDHTNKYLYAGKLPWAYEAGRLVMPLFGCVIAYNLARSSDRTVIGRTMKRLFWFGLAAAPMYYALVGIWPLNVLFTLLVSAAVIALLDRGGAWNRTAAVFVFALGGALVEFWWPAVTFVVAMWFYCRQPRASALALAVAALAGLTVVNGNWWALAIVPVLVLASRSGLTFPVPRMKWLFYFFYPAHLAVLLLVVRLGGAA